MKKPLIIIFFQIFLFQVFSQHINPGVVLTFDDNAIANWHKLLPIFQKYNAKATFYICYPHLLNADQQQMVLDLHAASNEIAFHGYHHVNSVHYVDTSNIENFINQEILPGINWFDSVLKIPIQSFSYPYGARNSRLDLELLNHFQVLRGTIYSFDSELSKVTSLSNVGLIFGVGIDDGYGFSLNQIKGQIDKCKRDSLIQVFYSHTPVEKVSTDYQITYANLDSILNYISQSGLSFYLSNEVWLPIPMAPSGDTVIFTDEKTVSTYYIDSFDYSNEWTLLPIDAGKLNINENEAVIEWNKDFKGVAALKVAATNRCGTGSFSDPLNIQVNNYVKISESYTENISIYPNPSKGEFQVLLHGINSKARIAIYNLIGELIFAEDNIPCTFNIILEDKGMYIIKTDLDNKTYMSKIIIE